MSMKLTPSSTARRTTRLASSRSFGSPQMPEPVIRMAPKPSRYTGPRSMISSVPLCWATVMSATTRRPPRAYSARAAPGPENARRPCAYSAGRSSPAASSRGSRPRLGQQGAEEHADRHVVVRPVHHLDRVPGLDRARTDHPQVGPRPAVRGEELEPSPSPPPSRGRSRTGCAATVTTSSTSSPDPPALADPRLVHVDPGRGQVLAEEAVGQLAAQPLRPAVQVLALERVHRLVVAAVVLAVADEVTDQRRCPARRAWARGRGPRPGRSPAPCRSRCASTEDLCVFGRGRPMLTDSSTATGTGYAAAPGAESRERRGRTPAPRAARVPGRRRGSAGPAASGPRSRPPSPAARSSPATPYATRVSVGICGSRSRTSNSSSARSMVTASTGLATEIRRAASSSERTDQPAHGRPAEDTRADRSAMAAPE